MYVFILCKIVYKIITKMFHTEGPIQTAQHKAHLQYSTKSQSRLSTGSVVVLAPHQSVLSWHQPKARHMPREGGKGLPYAPFCRWGKDEWE